MCFLTHLLSDKLFGIFINQHGSRDEMTLLRKLHKELIEKNRLEQHEMTPLHAGQVSFRMRRKQEIEGRKEQRAILMVVISGFVNLLLRLPELSFLFTISDELFSFHNHDFLQFFGLFPSLLQFMTDFSYFAYILTFSCNFLIYYLFNLKFKQTFSEWTHVKKRH
jgi:hypothetical protein